MDLTLTFQKLGIALGLGLLVGLQRERVASWIAGFRTFPLVTLLGAVCALLAQQLGGWILGLGFVGLAAVILAANLMLAQGPRDPGQTTEVALLLMFGVGAYLMVGHIAVGVALGGVTAVLLYLKEELHAFAGRIGERDFRAIMQFVLISMVILPVLPNRTYGPFEVLNPQQIWWMVVLIVGIGLGGYIAYKVLGSTAGTALAGFLGGMISSTATTVSYARRSRALAADAAVESIASSAAVAILIASTVVFGRVLVEIAVVAPSAVSVMAPPLAAVMAILAVPCILLWLTWRGGQGEMPEQGNPSDLRPAIVFALLYALLLVVVTAVQEFFGQGALYLVSILSGLTDMDAITLSTSRLVQQERLAAATGWRLILVASMANLVFKGVTVALLGRRELARKIALGYAVALAAGAAVLWLWPTGP